MTGPTARIPAGAFRVAAVDVRPERCLNSLHFGRQCRQCADVCPVTAIWLADEGVAAGDHGGERLPTAVAVDPSLCVRCGACLRACPTEALADAWSPEDGLVRPMPRQDPGPLEVVCPRVVSSTAPAAPTVESRVPDAFVLGAPRCLAAIAPRHLLQLSHLGRRDVWLHDAACPSCPLAPAARQLAANAREANAWLTNYGRRASIRLYRGSDAALAAPSRRRVTAVGGPTTRRAFLKKALGLDGRSGPQNDRLPRARWRLLQMLDSLDLSPRTLQTEALPVTNLSIDGERCSACGLCARFCGTGALQFVSDEAAFGLFFTARRCIDCGLCALACPESAISFAPELPGADWAQSAASQRHVGALRHCRDCPAMIADKSDSERCFVCRRKSPLFEQQRRSVTIV